MSSRTARSIRFKGRSYFFLTLAPDAPLADWLARLDAWLERSPAFFAGDAVMLDVRDAGLDEGGYRELLAQLRARGVRLLGVEGADAAWSPADGPPHVPASREARARLDAPTWGKPLYHEAPVRSGQRVVHPEGDLIVIGSVSSGAEVVAAGSIHIYGALRGRAMAGGYGEEGGKIFCRSLEAELLAVNGLYRTADDIDPALRRRPACAWLAEGAMHIKTLD